MLPSEPIMRRASILCSSTTNTKHAVRLTVKGKSAIVDSSRPHDEWGMMEQQLRAARTLRSGAAAQKQRRLGDCSSGREMRFWTKCGTKILFNGLLFASDDASLNDRLLLPLSH